MAVAGWPGCQGLLDKELRSQLTCPERTPPPNAHPHPNSAPLQQGSFSRHHSEKERGAVEGQHAVEGSWGRPPAELATHCTMPALAGTPLEGEEGEGSARPYRSEGQS